MSLPYDENLYKAMVIRHVDADTTVIQGHAPWDMSLRMTVRWAGIDAPERFTPAGKAATAWLNQQMPPGTTVILQTLEANQPDKYGRYVATFWIDLDDPISVNQQMVNEGYAVAYEGGAR